MVEDKEQRIETLQDRVDELEATVSKMLPSRRDALKLGAAGAVGAVGMAGSASAQNSNQVGTIGTDSERVDVNAEDIDAVSVNTDDLSLGPSNEYLFAASDAELDDALSAVPKSGTIILGKGPFSQDRTFVTDGLTLMGLGGGDNGTEVSATWTLNSPLQELKSLRGATVSIEGKAGISVQDCAVIDVTVVDQGGGERALISNCIFSTVTFQSGTSRSIADILVDSSVTDNGSNITGNIT